MADKSELDENVVDQDIALWKGIVGAIPFGGPMLAEIISIRVPNQRLDRVAAFVKELEKRVSDIEHKQLSDNAFYVDLLEDAIVQSTRSLSEKRNIYIATFLEKNIDIQEGDYSVKKKLLHTLEDLTDVDIEILNSLNDHGFQHTSSEYTVRPVSIANFKQMSEREQYEYELAMASWEAHMNALEQRKLVFAKHVVMPDKPDINELYMDEKTGLTKVEDYEISSVGKMLLKSIGIYTYKANENALREK